jgi:hypothetical protein
LSRSGAERENGPRGAEGGDAPPRATFDGAGFALEEPAQRSELEDHLREFFGPHASLQQLIDTCSVDDVRLDALRLSRHGPDLFETRMGFANRDQSVSGTFVNVWQRGDRGRLVRTRQGRLFISGSRSRLGLQLHANLVDFARRTERVDRVEVEAREVGRYAYRFMHGVEVDAATRAEIGRRLWEARGLLGVEVDTDLFETLRSPREIVDFLVLRRIREPWMETVDEIVLTQGFRFTVDQVLDVARRPGLAFLLDQPAYCMSLQVTDDCAYATFLESARLGRRRESLQRLRGVLGNPFSQLPKRVRSSLLTYRPFLFPLPRETPKIPELDSMAPPRPPLQVLGFRASDGTLVRSVPADPPETRLRDYRAQEVERAARAVLDGVRLVSMTGLSGAGKTEMVIWNLEAALAAQGHQVVSLDAQQLIKRADAADLLGEIDDVVRPTVVIFDESLYIRGPRKSAFLEFAERFLEWTDRHLVFVGGGRESPEAQRTAIERELGLLFERFEGLHVPVLPKPVNLRQAFRFLGLGRLAWASDEEKRALLHYTLERIPPYPIPLVPVRLHEHPAVRDLDQARALIDAEVSPDYWREMAGMVFEGDSRADAQRFVHDG